MFLLQTRCFDNDCVCTVGAREADAKSSSKATPEPKAAPQRKAHNCYGIATTNALCFFLSNIWICQAQGLKEVFSFTHLNSFHMTKLTLSGEAA